MKNVLQILNYAANYRGNFIDSLDELSNELGKKGVKNIYLFTKDAKEKESITWINELKENGAIVFFLNDDPKSDKRLIRQIIKDYSVDIIHTHFITMQHFLMISGAVGRKNIRMIMHFHNHAQKFSNPLKSMLRSFIYRKTEMIGVSESVSEGLTDIYKKNKVYCVCNAINFNRLDDFSEIRFEDTEWSESVKCLVFGFDYFRKGVDLAVKAVDNLRRKGSKIILCISLSTNREMVENEIKKEFGSIPSWIRIMKARNDVASYYRMADVFLSPSREEGFCYSVVEAAYCGAKIVASKIPAQDKLKVPESFWFTSEDVDDFASKIEAAINHTDGLSKEDKREYLKKEYDLRKWAEQIVNIYEGNTNE